MLNLRYDIILALVITFFALAHSIGIFPKSLKKSRPSSIPYSNKNIGRLKLLYGRELSEDNRAKLGSIYMQRDGFRYEVVLTTLEQLKQYYSSHPKHHSKLDTFGAGQYLVALLGDCLGFQNGDLWMVMRKLFNVYFSHALAVKTLPTMVGFITDHVKSSIAGKLEKVDPFEYVSDIPFTCIANYLYGEKNCTPERLEELKALIPLHTELLTFAFSTFIGRFKLFQYLPSQQAKGLKHFQKKYTELSLEMVKDPGDDPSVARQLYEKVEQGELSFDSWIQTLDEILFANIDVTATVMAWSVVEMARNTQCQQNLREEISQNQEPQEEYVKRTDTYLHRVLLETLRLHPLLWFGFPEVVSRKMVIDGYEIAANTPIVIDQYQVNYNSKIWNPPHEAKNYGHEFHPERFEGLGNRDVLLSSITFGSGPRRCLGKNFAEVVVKTLLVEAVSHFKISLCEEVKLAENTFVVQPKTTVLLERSG